MSFEILGLIPARKGSKGIPRKNVRLVGNKPLITWSLEAAQAVSSISRLIVSTDDPEVVELAQAAGVEVPFLRPAEYASDQSLAADVIGHAVTWLQEKENYQPDFVLWLQPTSPFRTTADIEAAISLLREKKADSVVSVCPVEHQHPALLKRIDENGLLGPWITDRPLPQRRQELTPAFYLNGAIYMARRELLLEQRTFYSEATYAYVMPPERSLDIDLPWELYVADLILKDQAYHGSN